MVATSGQSNWHPVLPAHELVAGHGVVAALLLGQSLALWRSASGQAQAWENRCPHRGVALSLGRVDGEHLACAYHGWQYAAGSGRCVLIPALPDIPVPGKVAVRTFAVQEHAGMVWVDPEIAGATSAIPARAAESGADANLPTDPAWFCRTLVLRAGILTVKAALSGAGLAPLADRRWRGTVAGIALQLFVLQAGKRSVFLHVWCEQVPGTAQVAPLLAALRRLRSDTETMAESGCLEPAR